MLMIFGKNFRMVVVRCTKVMIAVKLAEQFIESIKLSVFFYLQLCVHHVELHALASSSNEVLSLNTISWGYFYHRTTTLEICITKHQHLG